MRHATRFLVLVGALALPAAIMAKGKPQPMPCPPDVVAAVASACPCASSSNHGQYVRCVVHMRNALRKGGCLTGDALKTMARCAAHSTCGKEKVLCCHYVLGTCNDPMPGDGVKAGVCSNDAMLACDTAADCTTSSSHISQDATACMADGGVVVAGGGSVCTPCPPPPSTTTTTLH
jgi:hypothetical protein